jgi:hypothetical protein
MLVTLPSPISKLQHTLLPLKVLQARERATTPRFSDVFSLDSHLSPLKSLGACQRKFFELLRVSTLKIDVCAKEVFQVIESFKFQVCQKEFFVNVISFNSNFRFKQASF